ncbi:MAG TPA: hypothetical protein PKD56_01585, partial [Chitinophagales bacterium]|nr:hypothetical protein [Chitinophagales bacterium]
FAQIGFNNITYTTTYLDDGSLGTTDNLTREITDQTLQLYAEYGLTNNITLLLNAPYKLTEAKKIGASPRPEGSLNGVGNISVGGKYGILKGKINLAATLRYDAQTAKADELTGLRTGYDASVIAPGVAIGLGGNKWHVGGDANFNIRTNGYSTDISAIIEGGYRILKPVLLMAVLDMRKSFKNGSVVDFNQTTELYTDDQEFMAFGGKLNIDIAAGFGLNLWGYGALAGRKVPAAPSIGAGLCYTWQQLKASLFCLAKTLKKVQVILYFNTSNC